MEVCGRHRSICTAGPLQGPLGTEGWVLGKREPPDSRFRLRASSAPPAPIRRETEEGQLGRGGGVTGLKAVRKLLVITSESSLWLRGWSRDLGGEPARQPRSGLCREGKAFGVMKSSLAESPPRGQDPGQSETRRALCSGASSNFEPSLRPVTAPTAARPAPGPSAGDCAPERRSLLHECVISPDRRPGLLNRCSDENRLPPPSASGTKSVQLHFPLLLNSQTPVSVVKTSNYHGL